MSTPTSSLASATEALQRSSLTALRRLSVQECEEKVLLRGQVPTFYMKQLAQELIRPILAGRLLINEVTVQQS